MSEKFVEQFADDCQQLRRTIEDAEKNSTVQLYLDASAAAQALCRDHGFATGHGDTLADIIREIDGQIGQSRKSAWAIERVILRRLRENRIAGYTKEMSEEIAALPSAPAQGSLDWLRWGLEEIGRCTEPRAGSGDTLILRIVNEALSGAGIPLDAAGIKKPTAKATAFPSTDSKPPSLDWKQDQAETSRLRPAPQTDREAAASAEFICREFGGLVKCECKPDCGCDQRPTMPGAK